MADGEHKARRVELLISNLLRVGVIVSLFVIVFGTTLSFRHHRDYLSSPRELQHLTHPGTAFPHTFGEVFRGVRAMQGRAIVVLGLMLLIATPVLRVAVSIFAFVYERDLVFVLITGLVLGLLILSSILGRVEG
ncbi:MAG TPA: DUF1634 domain-containing protein [Tepidisphaeraceae bacterium]|jgi:uncharacterized membrane protein